MSEFKKELGKKQIVQKFKIKYLLRLQTMFYVGKNEHYDFLAFSQRKP